MIKDQFVVKSKAKGVHPSIAHLQPNTRVTVTNLSNASGVVVRHRGLGVFVIRLDDGRTLNVSFYQLKIGMELLEEETE